MWEAETQFSSFSVLDLACVFEFDRTDKLVTWPDWVD